MKRVLFAALFVAVMIYLVGCTLPGPRCAMAGCSRAAVSGTGHCRDHQGTYTASDLLEEEICRNYSRPEDHLVYNK